MGPLGAALTWSFALLCIIAEAQGVEKWRRCTIPEKIREKWVYSQDSECLDMRSNMILYLKGNCQANAPLSVSACRNHTDFMRNNIQDCRLGSMNPRPGRPTVQPRKRPRNDRRVFMSKCKNVVRKLSQGRKKRAANQHPFATSEDVPSRYFDAWRNIIGGNLPNEPNRMREALESASAAWKKATHANLQLQDPEEEHEGVWRNDPMAALASPNRENQQARRQNPNAESRPEEQEEAGGPARNYQGPHGPGSGTRRRTNRRQNRRRQNSNTQNEEPEEDVGPFRNYQGPTRNKRDASEQEDEADVDPFRAERNKRASNQDPFGTSEDIPSRYFDAWRNIIGGDLPNDPNRMREALESASAAWKKATRANLQLQDPEEEHEGVWRNDPMAALASPTRGNQQARRQNPNAESGPVEQEEAGGPARNYQGPHGPGSRSGRRANSRQNRKQNSNAQNEDPEEEIGPFRNYQGPMRNKRDASEEENEGDVGPFRNYVGPGERPRYNRRGNHNRQRKNQGFNPRQQNRRRNNQFSRDTEENEESDKHFGPFRNYMGPHGNRRRTKRDIVHGERTKKDASEDIRQCCSDWDSQECTHRRATANALCDPSNPSSLPQQPNYCSEACFFGYEDACESLYDQCQAGDKCLCGRLALTCQEQCHTQSDQCVMFRANYVYPNIYVYNPRLRSDVADFGI